VRPFRVATFHRGGGQLGEAHLVAEDPDRADLLQRVVAVGGGPLVGRQVDLQGAVIVQRAQRDASHQGSGQCDAHKRAAGVRPPSRPQQAQANAQRHLERAIPQRILQQAVQRQHRQHRPGQLPQRIGLTPRSGTPGCPQGGTAQDQRHRSTQFHRQVQRQVMGVVQDVAEPHTLVQVHVMGVVQPAPAPAEPRLLPDQFEHVRPQGGAARATVARLPLRRVKMPGCAPPVTSSGMARRGQAGRAGSDRRQHPACCALPVQRPTAKPDPGSAATGTNRCANATAHCPRPAAQPARTRLQRADQTSRRVRANQSSAHKRNAGQTRVVVALAQITEGVARGWPWLTHGASACFRCRCIAEQPIPGH
jgi:hypothetical protein